MNGGGVDVFFAWEEQLSTIVANVVMQVAYSDKCEWLSDPDTGYSVRDALSSVSLYPRETSSHIDLIWNKFVP
jgi:hypothetical protein